MGCTEWFRTLNQKRNQPSCRCERASRNLYSRWLVIIWPGKKIQNQLMAHFNWLGIYGDVCRWCAAGCKCQLVNSPATRKKRQECQPRLYNLGAWLQEFLQGNEVLLYIYGLFSKGRNWELKETVIQVIPSSCGDHFLLFQIGTEFSCLCLVYLSWGILSHLLHKIR